MVKKRGRIKIHSNWKLLIIIIVLIVLFAILIYFLAKNNNHKVVNTNAECKLDNDCVAVCGCHPNLCIPKIQRGNCENMFCTMDCEGPLDCGAGHCGCVNGKCDVVSK